MFHKLPFFLNPFWLINVATLYIDGPDINQPDPINQGEARRDFLEAEIDLAPDVLEAQQRFGPQFAQSDFDILLNTILGQNTTDENRTEQIAQANSRINDLNDLISEQQRIIDAPTGSFAGKTGGLQRMEHNRKVNEAQNKIKELQSELGSARGDLLKIQEATPGDGTRSGGLAELLGGTEIANIARSEGLLDALSRAEASANTIRRDSDLSDVESFVSRFGSDEDIDRLRTDELNRSIDRIEGLNTDTDTDIGIALRQQALEGLEEGLTDRERREIQQAVRSGAEARGRTMDPGTILNEAEATVLADRNRLNQNRAFAQNVDSMDLNKLLNDRAFSLNTAQATQGAGFDPFAAILGRSSGAPGIAQAQIGNAFPFVQNTPSFDTTGGLDIALGNQANQAGFNSAMAGANATAGGSSMGLIGSLGGQLLGPLAGGLAGSLFG